MNKYREIKGNLLSLADKGEFDIIVHGCNCQKVMGAGIALSISQKYPKAYLEDLGDKRQPIERLGDMTTTSIIVDNFKKLIIANLYTQLNPGKNLSYPALELCLYKINELYSGLKIGLPLIGCGIAGGDWNYVQSIVKAYLVNMDVTVVHYKS